MIPTQSTVQFFGSRMTESVRLHGLDRCMFAFPQVLSSPTEQGGEAECY